MPDNLIDARAPPHALISDAMEDDEGPTTRDEFLGAFVQYLMLRNVLSPPEDLDLDELLHRLHTDMQLFGLITSARYLNDRTSIPKAGSLHLAFEYAKNPAHHHLFVQMLRISPALFSVLVGAMG